MYKHLPSELLSVILIIFNLCLLQDDSGGKAGGTDGEGEEAKPTKPGKKAPIPEKEKPAESSESEERDSVEEEDSEDDEESIGNGRNGPTDRRRSSLMVSLVSLPLHPPCQATLVSLEAAGRFAVGLLRCQDLIVFDVGQVTLRGFAGGC